MEKSKHSLIRLERIDGETVHESFQSDDPKELIAMIADGMADILCAYPKHYRSARKLMRSVFRDYKPESPFDWLTEYWHWNLLGAGVLFGTLYGFAALMRAVGVA